MDTESLIDITKEETPVEFVDYFYDDIAVSNRLDPSIDKYEFAAKKMKIKNMHAFLKKTRLELKDRANIWINDYVKQITDKKKLSKVLLKIRTGDNPKVDIDVDDSGKLYTCVRCIECQKDIRVSMQRMKTPGNSLCKFNRQNFDRHMIRQHLHIKAESYAQIC